MKTFFYSIIVVISSFISLNTYSQDIFLGTWEYQEGNEIFRVHLSLNPEDNNHIIGHYEKVQVNNGIETYIYSSNKEEFIGNNKGWLPYVITSRSGDNTKIYGTINDNTVDENLYHQLKAGRWTLEILTNSGGFNPTITAHWKVERKSYQSGLTDNEAPEFSVPTDIVLTKVN